MNIDEKLIKEVRRHNCLFDLSSNLFKNNSHKEEIWAHIGQRLNVDGDVCRKKWKGLRDTYRRVKRTQILASGGGAPYPKKMWRYFESMAFLDDVQSYRSTTCNIVEPLEELAVGGSASDPLSPASPAESTSSSLFQKEDPQDFSKFMQTMSTSVQDIARSFTPRRQETSTELLFSSLARTLDGAHMPPAVLESAHQEVIAIVYAITRKWHSANN